MLKTTRHTSQGQEQISSLALWSIVCFMHQRTFSNDVWLLEKKKKKGSQEEESGEERRRDTLCYVSIVVRSMLLPLTPVRIRDAIPRLVPTAATLIMPVTTTDRTVAVLAYGVPRHYG